MYFHALGSRSAVYLTPGFRETGGQPWPGVRRLPQTGVLARGFYMLCTLDKMKGIG